MGKSYFPSADAAFDEWLRNFDTQLEQIGQAVGLPS